MSSQDRLSTLVWTMSESKVYHLDVGCAALTRSNRYYSPRQVPLDEATSNQSYRGQRRPCKLCADDGRR